MEHLWASTGMAERYRIRRLSADDIQDAEAKRRAAINAERIKLGYSRKEAASALPGAAFLAQGKRARSQQTGERAEFFKAQQTEKSMLVANVAAAARHGQLLRGGALTVSVYCCMVMYYVWLYCCTDWCIHTVYETTCVVTLTDVLLILSTTLVGKLASRKSENACVCLSVCASANFCAPFKHMLSTAGAPTLHEPPRAPAPSTHTSPARHAPAALAR